MPLRLSEEPPTPRHCPECDRCFASDVLYQMHRIGKGGTKECADVLRELTWRVDDNGCWTTMGHRGSLPGIAQYRSQDEHRSEGHRKNYDDPAGAW